MRGLPRWMKLTFWIGLALFAVIQFVPYGHAHANPPVTRAAAFGPGAGLDIARGACFDCHSNESTWPWYSNVAPMSWLIQRDVDEGRNHLNFSEWDQPQEKADDLVKVVQEGEMPPFTYTLLHPDARLTDDERATLIASLRELLATDPPIDGDNSGPG